MSIKYGTKDIASLTDKQLGLAEADVANCLLRAADSPNAEKYNAYFQRLSDQANAIQDEKARRT